MEVPILKQGAFLIATFQAALSDADLNQLRMGLVQQVVKFRSRAVIVDVTAMDVMDSGLLERQVQDCELREPLCRLGKFGWQSIRTRISSQPARRAG